MNTEKDNNNSLEERIVALLLGEVDEKERVELERAMQENPALAEFYREMEKTVKLLREATKNVTEPLSETDVQPQSLAPERRRQLLDYFKKQPNCAAEQKHKWYEIRISFVAGLVVVFLVVFIVGVSLPSLSKAKAKALRVSYQVEQKQLEFDRKLNDQEWKEESEIARANVPEEPAPQPQQPTVGGVLSQTFFRQDISKRRGSQLYEDQTVARFYDGTSESAPQAKVEGQAGFGGMGGGAYAGRGVSGELKGNIAETRQLHFGYAPQSGTPPSPSQPPTTPTPVAAPATVPPITPPPPAKPSSAVAGTELAKAPERLSEAVSSSQLGASSGTPVLGSRPSLGTEFSREKAVEQNRLAGVAAEQAITPGKDVTWNASADALGKRENLRKELGDVVTAVGADKAGVVEEKTKLATGLITNEAKQRNLNEMVVNGVMADSKREVESLNLKLPAPTLKATAEDISAASVAGKKDKVEGLSRIDAIDTKKLAEVRDRYDIPTESKPAEKPRQIQPEILTAENPFSTFSLNVSDVSFKTTMASLQNNVLPDPNSIREEEFINAFTYNDPAPPRGAKIGFYWERARYPFAHNCDIVRFSVQTAAFGRGIGKPLNLVILLDNSGSMERPDRVAIIAEAMKALANQLRPGDKVSVIAFARTARLIIDGMVWGNPDAFLSRVLNLNPHGGTNLEEAMRLGYKTALKHFIVGGINRVILLTDGAANLGDVEPESLKNLVIEHRQKGVALDCFGIGWEGYNDELLEVLSRNGDGRYAFMNEPELAPVEFAKQLAGALKVAAADVKVQVEFNPSRVISYRQIGYAKHQLTKEQFRDNTVDAAEIGEAESGNALYIIQVNPNGTGNIGTFRVRYKDPDTGAYFEREWTLIYQQTALPLEQASPSLRLATVAGIFAEWLAQNPYSSHINLLELERLMVGVPEALAPDQRPRQLLTMIQQARKITGR